MAAASPACERQKCHRFDHPYCCSFAAETSGIVAAVKARLGLCTVTGVGEVPHGAMDDSISVLLWVCCPH